MIFLQISNINSYSSFVPGPISLILDSFDNSTTEINALGDSFLNQVNNDNIKMLETFDALQVTVRYLKTDMLSLMGVDVDYVDADGD